MTKALFRLGVELCDEVERLAPLTRPQRMKAIDLTSATLTVRSQRLRGLLGRVFAAKPSTDETAASVNEAVDQILGHVVEWRRQHPGSDADEACQLVSERGELFLKLHRRAVEDEGDDAPSRKSS